MQQFIRGEQRSFSNALWWVWTNLWGGEAVSFHLWCKHQRLKKPADFLSSVCVIEPSAHESSAGRDGKNEKQSSLLIFFNSCDHTYKHTLLLRWWFSRTHDKLTLRWGSWVKINTTQWQSLPLRYVWESLNYVQAPETDKTKEKINGKWPGTNLSIYYSPNNTIFQKLSKLIIQWTGIGWRSDSLLINTVWWRVVLGSNHIFLLTERWDQ